MSTTGSPCHLFRIPVELRLIIFELALCQVDGSHIDLTNELYKLQMSGFTRLSRTSRQVYNECAKMTFRLNTFYIHAPVLGGLQAEPMATSNTTTAARLQHPGISELQSDFDGIRIPDREALRAISRHFVALATSMGPAQTTTFQRLRSFAHQPFATDLRRLDVYLGHQTRPGHIQGMRKSWERTGPILRRLVSHTQVKISFDIQLSSRTKIAYQCKINTATSACEELDRCVPMTSLTLPERSAHNIIRTLTLEQFLATGDCKIIGLSLLETRS